MSSKQNIITLPDRQRPIEDTDTPESWQPGIAFHDTTRYHIVGSTETTDGYSMGENINPGTVGGNPYTDENGFYATVKTSSSTKYYTQHFIGNGSGLVDGNNKITQPFTNKVVATGYTAAHIPNVVGFYCNISSKPSSGSSSENDGCGRAYGFRIAGVYLNSSRKIRIMDLCKGGTKLFGHTWDTAAGSGWSKMAYYSKQMNTILDNNYLHIGWIFNFSHERTCGGGGKNKNCTGRIRYLTPIVSSNGTLTTSNATKHLVIPAIQAYSSVVGHSFKIRTL